MIFNVVKNKQQTINSIWLISEKVFQLLLSLIVSVYIARYLGPSKFGILGYAQSFVILFTALSSLGIDNILVREISNNKSNAHNLVCTGLFMKAIGGVVVLFLTTAIAYYFEQDMEIRIIIGFVSATTILSSVTVISLYFQALEKNKLAAKASFISYFISSILKLMLVYFEKDVIWFGGALLVDMLIQAFFLILFYFLFSKPNKPFFTFDLAKAKLIINESWPLLFSIFVATVYLRVDQIMLMQLMGERIVGIYSVAIKLNDMAQIIPLAIISSVFPTVVQAKKQTVKKYRYAIISNFEWAILCSLMIAIITNLLSSFIVILLYGNSYEEVTPIINVLVWGSVFSVLGHIRSRWVTIENLQKYTIVYLFISMIINIVLNLLLIPIYGAVGAAIASLIAQIVSGYIGVLFVSKTRLFFKIATQLINPFSWCFLEKKR